MRAIYKRELRSYFQSMTGCVFVAFLVIFTGIYFTAYNLNMGYPYFSYTLSGSLIVFLVGIPLITMKSFSEERKNKTDQLLLTAPVSLTKIVLGKYFAMVTVVAIPNLIFCLFPDLPFFQKSSRLFRFDTGSSSYPKCPSHKSFVPPLFSSPPLLFSGSPCAAQIMPPAGSPAPRAGSPPVSSFSSSDPLPFCFMRAACGTIRQIRLPVP